MYGVSGIYTYSKITFKACNKQIVKIYEISRRLHFQNFQVCCDIETCSLQNNKAGINTSRYHNNILKIFNYNKWKCDSTLFLIRV